MNNGNFWPGKRVLVTGATGFIGSHVCMDLLKQGALVVGVGRNAPQQPTEGLIFEQGDVLNFGSLLAMVQKHNIDTVFHFAASAIVSQAAQDPLPTLQNNTVGTMNILEVSRLCGVKRTIVASSDKAYGDHADDSLEPLPYRESYSLRGMDIYSVSKVCTDVLAQAYAFQFKMPIVVVRSGNVYGPGDLNFTRLIPKTIMMLLRHEHPLIKLGHEHVLREYVYIQDMVRACLFLAEHIEQYYGHGFENMPKKGKPVIGWSAFNIGSYNNDQLQNVEDCPNIKSVSQVIALLCKKIENLPPETVQKPAEFIEIPNEFLDASKLKTLGFSTAYTFEQGINESIAWYREHAAELTNKTIV